MRALVAQQPGVGHVGQQVDQAVDEGLVGVPGGQGTVQDGASHGLAFLGSIYGAPTVPLGMDQWGQSGSRAELYDYAGIDVDEIVNAAMLALELNEE